MPLNTMPDARSRAVIDNLITKKNNKIRFDGRNEIDIFFSLLFVSHAQVCCVNFFVLHRVGAIRKILNEMRSRRCHSANLKR